MNVYVITAGDTRSPNEFNGSPHKLVLALRQLGVTASGLNLRGPEYRVARILWGVVNQLAHPRRSRGFQYSMIAQLIRDLRFNLKTFSAATVNIVSMFQNPPRSWRRRGVRVVMYIDGTLTQLFGTYPEVAKVRSTLRARAIAREREAYDRSEMVLAKTWETRAALISVYGVDASKVVVMAPPPNVRFDVTVRPAKRTDALGVVAIARDYSRKNIPRVIRLCQRIRSLGVPVALEVVGLDENDLPVLDWISARGRLGSEEAAELARILGRNHVGALLSVAEIAGISLIEYQAVGLITVCSGVGGMPDVLFTETCYNIGPVEGAGDSALAELLARSYRADGLEAMLELAWVQRDRVPNWTLVARLIAKALG